MRKKRKSNPAAKTLEKIIKQLHLSDRVVLSSEKHGGLSVKWRRRSV